MIDPYEFLAHVCARGLSFFSGVPDSLLSGLCAAIEGQVPLSNHVIAPNEGIAVALGIGHYLATGSAPIIYLQNAGLGNTVNPLASLAAPGIYWVPMLLIVGWRGELRWDKGETTQIQDEPQHQLQGCATLAQLELLGIPYEVLDASRSDWREVVDGVIGRLNVDSAPAALVIRKDTFAKARRSLSGTSNRSKLNREEAIACCLRTVPEVTPIVATTGMAARELFELRKQHEQGHHRDFLCIGGMGLASQVAAGMALGLGNSKVMCIDGDGALLMHMGGMVVGARIPNLIHVVMNNEAHESVGGYASAALGLDLSLLARSCGYTAAHRVTTAPELEQAVRRALKLCGSAFIEVLCTVGHRSDLGRPTIPPVSGKHALMNFLRQRSSVISSI